MIVRYVSLVVVFECKMADGKGDQTTAAKQAIAQIRVCGHITKHRSERTGPPDRRSLQQEQGSGGGECSPGMYLTGPQALMSHGFRRPER